MRVSTPGSSTTGPTAKAGPASTRPTARTAPSWISPRRWPPPTGRPIRSRSGSRRPAHECGPPLPHRSPRSWFARCARPSPPWRPAGGPCACAPGRTRPHLRSYGPKAQFRGPPGLPHRRPGRPPVRDSAARPCRVAEDASPSLVEIVVGRSLPSRDNGHMDKRGFLRTACGASLGLTLGSLKAAFAERDNTKPSDLARDESFWATIRARYRLKADYINLENGYYCMQPQEVLEAFVDRVREVNFQGSYYMRTRQVDEKLKVRKRLAAMAGCSPDELIITRNTTESLDTVIAGFDWKPGDEAVMAEQDYGAMLDMFDLQARRHGVVNRRVSLPLDPQSDDEIVQLYANAITPKTRLLMVGHMVNITGQILPVRTDRGHGARQGRPGDGRWRPRLCPHRLQDSRPRLRLLRHQPPQVARRPTSAPARCTSGPTGSPSSGPSIGDKGVGGHDIAQAESHRHPSGAYGSGHHERDRLPRERGHRAQGSAPALLAELLDEPGAPPARDRPEHAVRSAPLLRHRQRRGAHDETERPRARPCSSGTGSGPSPSTPRTYTACASPRTSSPRPRSWTRSCGPSRRWPRPKNACEEGSGLRGGRRLRGARSFQARIALKSVLNSPWFCQR